MVRPAKPGNIGSAVRALTNFGFSDLRLVDPQCDPLDAEARKLAVQADHLLEKLPILPDLLTAVGDCQWVVGTSAQPRGTIRTAAQMSWSETCERICQVGSRNPVAVVFGPERTGLSNAEIRRCHVLATIPTSVAYPEMNLAQSVTVTAYELARRRLSDLPQPPPTSDFADTAELQRSLTLLREAVERIGFLRHDHSGQLMAGLERLVLRSSPTRKELDIVKGLARQILWHVDHPNR